MGREWVGKGSRRLPRGRRERTLKERDRGAGASTGGAASARAPSIPPAAAHARVPTQPSSPTPASPHHTPPRHHRASRLARRQYDARLAGGGADAEAAGGFGYSEVWRECGCVCV